MRSSLRRWRLGLWTLALLVELICLGSIIAIVGTAVSIPTMAVLSTLSLVAITVVQWRRNDAP